VLTPKSQRAIEPLASASVGKIDDMARDKRPGKTGQQLRRTGRETFGNELSSSLDGQRLTLEEFARLFGGSGCNRRTPRPAGSRRRGSRRRSSGPSDGCSTGDDSSGEPSPAARGEAAIAAPLFVEPGSATSRISPCARVGCWNLAYGRSRYCDDRDCERERARLRKAKERQFKSELECAKYGHAARSDGYWLSIDAGWCDRCGKRVVTPRSSREAAGGTLKRDTQPIHRHLGNEAASGSVVEMIFRYGEGRFPSQAPRRQEWEAVGTVGELGAP
jgi:hypothetical protein